jgi:FkbM family methyltransferase
MTIANVSFESICTAFEIDNPADHIQAFQAGGSFYELQQLLAHRLLIPMHSTVLDIGANCGNHTLFYARHTNAVKIYPFEPNPPAHQLLLRNIAANVDSRAPIYTSFSECALGFADDWVNVGRESENNLGATRMQPAGASGSIKCVKLDSVDIMGEIAFIKIDVEGMEMEVLRGAERVIAEFRPALAIEVDLINNISFWEWTRTHHYQVVSAFRDYLPVWNFIMVPSR